MHDTVTRAVKQWRSRTQLSIKWSSESLGIRNGGRCDVTTQSLRCRRDRTAALRALSHTKVVKLNLLDVGHDWVQERVRLNHVEAVRVDRQSDPSDVLT